MTRPSSTPAAPTLEPDEETGTRRRKGGVDVTTGMEEAVGVPALCWSPDLLLVRDNLTVNSGLVLKL